METLRPSYKEPECQHCRNNPAALKPYDEMVKVKYDTGQLERDAEKLGIKMDCLACRQAREFMSVLTEMHT